jgi:hypothetical protein
MYAFNNSIVFIDPLGAFPGVFEIIKRVLIYQLKRQPGSFLGKVLTDRELSTDAFIPAADVPPSVAEQARRGNPGGDDEGEGIPNLVDPQVFVPNPSIGPLEENGDQDGDGIPNGIDPNVFTPDSFIGETSVPICPANQNIG